MRYLILVFLLVWPTALLADTQSGPGDGLQKAGSLIGLGVASIPLFFAEKSEVSVGLGFGTPDDNAPNATFNLHGYARGRWGTWGYDALLLERSNTSGHHGRARILAMMSLPIFEGSILEARIQAGPQFGYQTGPEAVLVGLGIGPQAQVRLPLTLAQIHLLYAPFRAAGGFHQALDGVLRLVIGPDWLIHPVLEGRIGFGPLLRDASGFHFRREAALGVSVTW